MKVILKVEGTQDYYLHAFKNTSKERNASKMKQLQ